MYHAGLALDRLTVHFNPAYVGETAEAMTTAWSEIDKTDFVDFAQICLVEKGALGLHLFNIQLYPANIGQIKLAFVEVEGVRIGVISNEPGPVSQFDDGTNLVKPRRLGVPTNSCFSGQVREALLVPERN